MKITAIAKIDNTQILCTGEIIIHWINEPQAYISWSIFNDKVLIASKSEGYFFDENFDTEETLFKRAISKIENYKIRRKKIFENIEVSP